jgi:hypothetical protein
VIGARYWDFFLQRIKSDMSDGPTAMPSPTLRSLSILDHYCRLSPSHQNAVDIFQGEWSSQFPPPFENLTAGPLALFQDVRLAWAIDQLGGVGSKTVLELGPLEGGHAYMLEHAGALI